MQSKGTTPVAIVGAGPYGLSIAAHLASRAIPFRIFGRPMSAWRDQMPAGMFLKSDGHASNLSHPDGELTLEDFCRAEGRPYEHFGLPIPLDLFVDYGLAFQRRFVPRVEEVEVAGVRACDDGFALTLTDGETVPAAAVVVSAGCDPFRRLPASLAHLGLDRLSHSADHRDFDAFAGKTVCVVGAGASATDVAAALHAAGAKAHLVSRADRLEWVLPRTEMPRFESLAKLDVLKGGRYGQGYIYSQLPHLYRYLPGAARTHIARTYLGPRGGWPVRACVEALPQHLGASILRAEDRDGAVDLHLRLRNGERRVLRADHVISATGYRIDIGRMGLLSPELRGRIRTLDGAPELSPGFESNIRGLYFAGYAALHSFGPLMRFVAGSDFAARRVSSAIARSLHAQRPNAATAQGVPRTTRAFAAAPENE